MEREMPSPDRFHSILQKKKNLAKKKFNKKNQQQNQIPTYIGSIDMFVYVYSKEIPAFCI